MSRPEPVAAGPTWAEWLTVVVLVGMVAVLAWINVGLARRTRPPAAPLFDFKNPMLDARPQECVEIFAADAPRDAPCISVREEGVVQRPARGPESLGDRDGLRLALPYLAARVRNLDPASLGASGGDASRGTCAGGSTVGAEGVILYPLNAFGIPSENRVRVDSVRPQWFQSGGREQLVYEVVLQDSRDSTWICHVSPDALVTGLVQVALVGSKRGSRKQIFRYADAHDCT